MLQRVGCPETAQDLSQEAYLRMLRKEQVSHADNLIGYLYRIAERLALDFLRYDQRVTSKHDQLNDDLICPRTQPDTLIQLSWAFPKKPCSAIWSRPCCIATVVSKDRMPPHHDGLRSA
ncbi:RNA polymerase sigma factor [Methylomonas rhizoryzae]|uniref:RNA polymerase sigma factor n=1 Tax=Methylomonas rhizoryzae TaxID=2608981 RepID=UPI001E60AF0C|nr:sigma factor [Methylomonas rhizoryzae]